MPRGQSTAMFVRTEALRRRSYSAEMRRLITVQVHCRWCKRALPASACLGSLSVPDSVRCSETRNLEVLLGRTILFDGCQQLPLKSLNV